MIMEDLCSPIFAVVWGCQEGHGLNHSGQQCHHQQWDRSILNKAHPIPQSQVLWLRHLDDELQDSKGQDGADHPLRPAEMHTFELGSGGVEGQPEPKGQGYVTAQRCEGLRVNADPLGICAPLGGEAD